MKRFLVTYTTSHEIEIEAHTEEQAIELAHEIDLDFWHDTWAGDTVAEEIDAEETRSTEARAA